jgi:hypothetical protein
LSGLKGRAKFEGGGWDWAVDGIGQDEYPEDNRQQTTDNRQQTTDNRQQTTDSRQQTADICTLNKISTMILMRRESIA